MHRSRLFYRIQHCSLAVGRFSRIHWLYIVAYMCVVREFDTLYLSNKLVFFHKHTHQKKSRVRKTASNRFIQKVVSDMRNLGNNLINKKTNHSKAKYKSTLLIELIRDIRFCFVFYFISRIGIMC